jgi:hypothetical protein
MKIAEIYAVPAAGEPGYAWKWRSTNSKATSAGTFHLYFDCVTDAREHGYQIEATPGHGITAPGGAPHEVAHSLDKHAGEMTPHTGTR